MLSPACPDALPSTSSRCSAARQHGRSRHARKKPCKRIGVLMGRSESDREAQAFVAACREELQKLGWAEGRNIRIDYRWATPGDAGPRQSHLGAAGRGATRPRETLVRRITAAMRALRPSPSSTMQSSKASPIQRCGASSSRSRRISFRESSRHRRRLAPIRRPKSRSGSRSSRRPASRRQRRFSIDRTDTNIGAWSVFDWLQ